MPTARAETRFRNGPGKAKPRMNRVTIRPEYAAKPTPPKAYVAKLTKVTLPALRCLSEIDFSLKGWRPQGQEA